MKYSIWLKNVSGWKLRISFKFINESLIISFQNDLDDPERGMIFVCSATHKTKVCACCFIAIFYIIVEKCIYLKKYHLLWFLKMCLFSQEGIIIKNWPYSHSITIQCTSKKEIKILEFLIELFVIRCSSSSSCSVTAPELYIGVNLLLNRNIVS